MAILNCDVSATSKAFALARTKAYTQNYVGIALNKMPRELQAQCKATYEALTGKQAEDTLEPVTIRAKQGTFLGLMTPCLGKDADGVISIKFGNEIIPWNDQVKAKVKTYNFSGRGEDVALILSVKNGSDTYNFPISVRFEDYKNPLTEAEFESLWDEDRDTLVSALALLKVGGGNGGGSTIENLSELAIGEYEVVSYRELKVSYGITYALKLNDGREFWADSNLRNIFALSPEMPANLSIIEHKTNKRGRVQPTYVFDVQTDSEDCIQF